MPISIADKLRELPHVQAVAPVLIQFKTHPGHPRTPVRHARLRDNLGALQQYRVENPYELKLLAFSFWLVDYPFAKILYPARLKC